MSSIPRLVTQLGTTLKPNEKDDALYRSEAPVPRANKKIVNYCETASRQPSKKRVNGADKDPAPAHDDNQQVQLEEKENKDSQGPPPAKKKAKKIAAEKDAPTLQQTDEEAARKDREKKDERNRKDRERRLAKKKNGDSRDDAKNSAEKPGTGDDKEDESIKNVELEDEKIPDDVDEDANEEVKEKDQNEKMMVLKQNDKTQEELQIEDSIAPSAPTVIPQYTPEPGYVVRMRHQRYEARDGRDVQENSNNGPSSSGSGVNTDVAAGAAQAVRMEQQRLLDEEEDNRAKWAKVGFTEPPTDEDIAKLKRVWARVGDVLEIDSRKKMLETRPHTVPFDVEGHNHKLIGRVLRILNGTEAAPPSFNGSLNDGADEIVEVIQGGMRRGLKELEAICKDSEEDKIFMRALVNVVMEDYMKKCVECVINGFDAQHNSVRNIVVQVKEIRQRDKEKREKEMKTEMAKKEKKEAEEEKERIDKQLEEIAKEIEEKKKMLMKNMENMDD